ncbi:glycosylase [Alginatibacterium sediminis]|uniref:Glycosylase n=1 Tax=Alginatibacterium sediminis TaxID=2164068 RepID=A0A420EG52_9ALTE|nr:glycosylase [Alginatibacterium sediminis]RKF19643.1 glycosylase [Alginatibacterium sediminis]
MFKWKKLGKVFDPTACLEREWLCEFAQAPSVLVFDDFIRVYFSCRPKADASGQYTSYSAFVDLSKSSPFKVIRVSDEPILSLGSLGEFDEFGTYPVSAIRHEGKVWAYYAGWTRCVSVPFNTAIGLAHSEDDGQQFTKFGSGPILSYSPDEPFVISGPKIRRFNGKWYLFYISGSKWVLADNGRAEPVYKIRMAVSDDGLNWHRMNKNLIENVLEGDEAQASPDVFYSNGRYHMFFSYRYSLGFRGKERGYRIGYASSSDLENWVRDDSKVGIDVSQSGWDSEMISYPHVFEIDNKVFMFYLGDQVGRFGFGAAELVGEL